MLVVMGTGDTEIVDRNLVELHDGTEARLHPMSASDAAGLLRFHSTLSPETTYFRFFTVHPSLSDRELHHFTHVDHTDREAIVATAGDEIIGVARFDRMQDPAEAEVAFVVADAWQELGLGTAMFRSLAQRAGEVAVARFVAEVLPHNRRMLAVFNHSGLPVRSEFRDGVVHLVLDL
jgi:RimJ/RimL family protein N-acetyltransferase